MRNVRRGNCACWLRAEVLKDALKINRPSVKRDAQISRGSVHFVTPVIIVISNRGINSVR